MTDTHSWSHFREVKAAISPSVTSEARICPTSRSMSAPIRVASHWPMIEQTMDLTNGRLGLTAANEPLGESGPLNTFANSSSFADASKAHAHCCWEGGAS